MNIQINTDNKTIKVIGNLALKDISKIKDMLGGSWDQYTLITETKTTIPPYNPSGATITRPWDTGRGGWPYSTLRVKTDEHPYIYDINANPGRGIQRHNEDQATITLPQ